MRHKKTQRRRVAPDILYESELVTQFINKAMRDGKKTVAQKHVYEAFSLIEKQGKNPLEAFEKVIQTIAPRQEVKARRVGGASYQIPVEVRGLRRTSLAIRWLISAARARSNREYHHFSQKLAAEILDAIEGKGEAVKKRDTMHRMAEANKAFAHFRW